MNIGNGYVELLGTFRDASSKVMDPLALQIIQGALGMLPVAGPPTTQVLHSTSALDVANGVIGAGATAGVAGDSMLTTVFIPKNAGPATLTITGLANEAGTAKSMVLTGSTSADTYYNFTALVNSAFPMTLQASVADVVAVTTAPYGQPATQSPRLAPAAPTLTLVGQSATRAP